MLQQLHRYIVGGSSDVLMGRSRAAIQGYFYCLKEWPTRNLTILNNGVGLFLHLGGNNLMHQYRLETGCLETSFAENVQEKKLGKSCQWAVCACDKSVLSCMNRSGASRLRK